MRVSFTCEKCGHEFGMQELQIVDPRTPASALIVRAMRNVPDCPHCAQLTYGPLTEEVVAEALEEAFDIAIHTENPKQGCGTMAQARFVLRLLKAVESDGLYHSGWGAEDRREWLLDLAREKCGEKP